jgi:GAF domain-containing protein
MRTRNPNHRERWFGTSFEGLTSHRVARLLILADALPGLFTREGMLRRRLAMVDQQRLQFVLREFTHTLVRHYDVGEVLYQLSDHVTDVLGVTGSGVSLLDDADVFVTATKEQVEQVERLQQHFQEGPCGDAATTGTVAIVADLDRSADRWPKYAPSAVERGMRGVMGIPMGFDGTAIGALNVYSSEPRNWTGDEISAARLLADMATAYVVMIDRLRSAEQLAGQLRQALDSRVVIEQAKGVLARSHDIDVSEAFERLRRYARGNNRRLHDAAAEVVAGTLHL